jgi:hypothetical protein
MTQAVLPAGKVADAAALALKQVSSGASVAYIDRLKFLHGLAEAAHFYIGGDKKVTISLEDFALIFETYKAVTFTNPADPLVALTFIASEAKRAEK